MLDPTAIHGMRKVRESLKALAFQSPLGMLLFYNVRLLRERAVLARYNDSQHISAIYRKRFGREINLKNPAAYTEKLQWLKLFYRHPDMPTCSDKYAVREYLIEKGYGKLLNESIGVYEDAQDIDFEALPERFVAKATHGSSWNLICTDKSSLDWRMWKKVMNKWLHLNLYAFGREWNYRTLRPRIIVERFIDQSPLIDYKFFCFNGKPQYIQVNNDSDGSHYLDFYDLDWNKQEVTYEARPVSSHSLNRPSLLEEMTELAKDLSAPFPFARVDFYNIESRIVFGEITFFPGGGLRPIVSAQGDYDAELGAYLRLPEPNHNLDLYRTFQG